MSESSDSTNPFVFNLDTSVYSYPAIMNALYDYTDKATFEVTKLPDGQVRLSLIPKASVFSTAMLVENFKNLLIDHQVRIMVSQDYKVIRDIIVAQAFQPCENVEDIIELLKP